MKRHYKHAVTGKIGLYSERVADLIPTLELVEGKGECEDCKIDFPEDEEELTPNEVMIDYDYDGIEEELDNE